MTRKQYRARFQAKVAMEAMRGGKPMNELASRFGLHPTQIAQWKKQALEGLPEIFTNHRGQQGKGEGLEAALYQQIGRLQMEVAWLKKKYGLAAGGAPAVDGPGRSGVEHPTAVRTAGGAAIRAVRSARRRAGRESRTAAAAG